LSREKFKVLAERNGWSLAYAEGYVDGEFVRRRGHPMGPYPLVGIDEYSLGFRAAYYGRQDPESKSAGGTDTPESAQGSAQSVDKSPQSYPSLFAKR